MSEQAIKPWSARLPQLQMPSMAQVLRWIGVAALSGAFISFLFQEWQGGNDLMRYLMLLGLTLGLGAGGVVNGIWLKEQKGARTFLALALASLPVNFAVLGAFLYQHFGLDGDLPTYPPSALWQVDTPFTALLLFALAVPLLAALAHFAFKVHARGLEMRLRLVYLIGNLAIAIPTRSGEFGGLLALAMIGVLIVLLPRRLEARRIAATFEGWLALAVLFLPAALLIGRTLWLYGGSDLFVLLSFTGLHLILRYLTRQLQGWWRRLLDVVSVVSAFFLTVALLEVLEHHHQWLFLLLAPSVAALCYEIGLRRLAAFFLVLGLGMDMLFQEALIHGLFSLSVGIGLIAWGVNQKRKLPLITGVLLVLISLTRQLTLAITLFDLSSWGSLTAIGIAAVITASLLERYGKRFPQLRQRFSHWQ